MPKQAAVDAHPFRALRTRTEGSVLFAEISAPPMNLLGPELVRGAMPGVLADEGHDAPARSRSTAVSRGEGA